MHSCAGLSEKILTINYNKYILPSHRDRMVRVQLRPSTPCLKNEGNESSCVSTSSLALPQVACVSNFFEQPVEPVVSQEEDESHTSLQENPSNGNHYGSTD